MAFAVSSSTTTATANGAKALLGLTLIAWLYWPDGRVELALVVVQQPEHCEGECVVRVRADVVGEMTDRVFNRDDLVLIDSAGGASLGRLDDDAGRVAERHGRSLGHWLLNPGHERPGGVRGVAWLPR